MGLATAEAVDPVEQKIDDMLPMIRRAENSGDAAVSPAGAIGRYQIMPATARSLGFDPDKLTDPDYNEKAARAVLGDLIKQHGIDDTKAILAGYNASPGAVNRWKAAGRDDSTLPFETQHYIARAGFLGATDGGQNKFGYAPDTTRVPDGQAQYQKYLDAGFTQQEAEDWKNGELAKQRAAGFNENEISDYWGSTPPNDNNVKTLVQNNLAQVPPDKAQQVVDDPWKAIEYGWRTSVFGLQLRGQGPGMVMPENAGIFNKIASGLTQSALDLPYMVLGAAGGATVGAAGGTAMAGPVGTVPGGVIGAGAGAMALPSGIRNTLMEHYDHPDGYKTWTDFGSAAGRVTVNTLKDAAVGAVTAPVAGKAGAVALEATGSKAVATAANLFTTATTATTATAALNGHAPNAEDYLVGAATLIPFAAGTHIIAGRYVPSNQSNQIAQNLRDIYRNTGTKPGEAVSMAQADPVVMGEVLSRNAYGEQMTPVLDRAYKTSPAKIADEHEQMLNSLFTEAAKKSAEENAPKEEAPTFKTSPGKIGDEHEDMVRSLFTEAAKKTAENAPDAEAAQEKAQEVHAAANVVSLEDARYTRTLARMGEDDYDMPPPGPPPEPEIISPEPGPKKVTDQTIHLNYDMLADKFMEGKVGTQERQSIWQNAKTIYRQFVTELFPARVLDDVFKPDSKNLGVEDMLRQTYASRERSGYFMRYGTLDALSFEDTGGPAYLKGYEAVKEDGGNFAGFTAYRIAQRTVDLAERGIDSGFDLDTAKQMVEKGKAQYARGSDLVNQNKNAAIDYARDSGVFSEKMAEGLKEANPSHIVLRRVSEPGYNPPRSRAFGVRQPVKKIKGSDLQIVDPTTADIENLHTIIAMADRNRAVGSIIGAIEATEAALPKDVRTFQLRETLEIGKHAEVLDANGNPIPEADKPAMEPFIAEKAARSKMGANDFIYYRNGRAEVWHTKDAELAQLLRTSQPGPEMHFVLKAFEKVAAFARLGITGAPDFPLRSNVRAQFEASILGKNGGVPMADFFHGIMDVAGTTETYKKWVANGGLGSSLVSMDTDYVARDLNKVFESTGTVNHVWNAIRHPLEALRIFRETIDSASRLGYAKRAEADGLSPAKAAVEGRKAYIDNAERAGLAVVNNWARIVPFMRSSILDVDQFVRAVKERPVSTMLKGAAWVSVPVIANYIANYYADQAHKGEPGFVPYSEMPRWQKDMFYVLPPINGVRIRLPLKPYVSSFFFGTLVERFLDFAVKDDPRAFKEWGDSFMAQFVPPVIPALALPVAEHYTNTRTVSQKALIPANLEGASGYMQYTPDTSETAKAISRYLSSEVGALSQWHHGVDVSPIVLENYAREWAGTLPFTILKALESPWHHEAHPWTVADIPFVQSFVARNPGMSAVSIQDFYDKAAEIEGQHKDLALALKRFDAGEIKESSSQVQAFVSLQDMKAAIANQATVLTTINQSDKMTNSEKLKYSDALYAAMVKTAQGGLKVADTLDGHK